MLPQLPQVPSNKQPPDWHSEFEEQAVPLGFRFWQELPLHPYEQVDVVCVEHVPEVLQ